MGSFCRLPGTSGCFPCPLSALEEHNFLFQLRGGEQPPPGAKEVSIKGCCVQGKRLRNSSGRERLGGVVTKEKRLLIHMMVPFVPPAGLRSPPDCCSSVVHPEAALHPEHLYPLPVSVWEPLMGTNLFTCFTTHTHQTFLFLNASSLPSIRLDRPCFVMTASCESPVRTYERFTVTYTLLNNLQDFLAVRLVWTPEHAQAGRLLPGWELVPKERRGQEEVMEVGDLWQAVSALYLGGLQCHRWRV